MTEKNFSGESHTSSAVTNGAFDIVALAASAGGLRALSEVLAALPAQFPAAIVVVQHLDPRHRSLMADIPSRRRALQVEQAEEGNRLKPGAAYIAPPNRHLLVNPDSTLSLSQIGIGSFRAPLRRPLVRISSSELQRAGYRSGPFPNREGAPPLPRCDVIVMVASSGGIETVSEVVSGLPPDLPTEMET